MSERVRELLHRLKRRVIRQPALRGLLRRAVLAPYQLRQLARAVRRLPPAAPPDGTVVLVLALRPWAISRAWETVLTRLLQAEGCRVIWAVCDRLVPRCDAMLGPRPEPGTCRQCIAFNRGAAAVAGAERVALSELPRKPSVRAGGGVVRASLQRILGRRPSAPGRAPAEERAIAGELEAGAARTAAVAGSLLDRVRPDAVLALNGKFFTEAILLAEAGARGIPVWTYERGNRRDTLVLTAGAAAIPFDSGGILARLDEPLSPEQRRAAEHYLARRAEVGNGQVSFLSRDAGAGVDFPAGEGRRLVALFTNLIWDSAVVGEDTLFADMFDWIVTTVETLAADPDVRLVVRVHPAEERVYWHPTRERVADVLNERFSGGLPPNVVLVDAGDPVDSYALIERADLVLVYASTVGMEAAAMGRRVVVAANSSFAPAPFVVRPPTVEAYRDELRSGRSAPPSADAPQLALRFLYRLFFETMLPVPAVREDPTGFRAAGAEDRGAGAADRPLAGAVREMVGRLRRRRGGSGGGSGAVTGGGDPDREAVAVL